MKLASRLLSGAVPYNPYDVWSLSSDLIDYRERYLSVKYVKNGYSEGIHKKTPDVLKKLFAAYCRKIKGLPVIRTEYHSDYLSGIKALHSRFYENTAKDQADSWWCKKLQIEADEYCKRKPLIKF